MKIQLTEEEKENLEYLHSQERDKNISDRIKSILLRDEGWSVSKIAQALRLHNDTVSRYIIGYINEKKIKPNHQGSNQKLNGDQTMMLIAHLNEKLYDKASAIAAYVKITYDIDYTANGMVDWLKRHNFTYKQSRGYPSKADTQKQEEFINIYKELKKVLQKKNRFYLWIQYIQQWQPKCHIDGYLRAVKNFYPQQRREPV
jgi:transposase